MDSESRMSRKEFLKAGALGTAGLAMAGTIGAPAILKARSPNNAIGVGVVGFGIRARQMMTRLGHFHPQAASVPTGFDTGSRADRARGYGHRDRMPVKPFTDEPIRAVCDIYTDARTYAGEMFGEDLRLYEDYRKLLDDKDIDAVMIFTPDHWHAKIAIDAVEAGKDIFIEKCPTHNWKEAVALKKAVESNKRVVQLNESGVHSPVAKKMREIVRSGALGKVHVVRAYKYIAAQRRVWEFAIPEDLSPKTIDWKAFLGSAPNVDFDPRRVIRWRCYWDYGTGMNGDLFSHTLATINMIMDIDVPKTAVASGGTYELKDYFKVPDVYHSVYEYPDKELSLFFSGNFTSSNSPRSTEYVGTDATMTNQGDEIHIFAEPQAERYKALGYGRQKPGVPSEIIKINEDAEMSTQEYHFHEFFDCMRTRNQTACNMDMTFGEDMSCHMGTEAFFQKRQVTWDREEMEIV